MVPAQVLNLAAVAATPASSLTLTWDALLTTPTSYRIYRSVDGGAETLQNTVGGGVTTDTAAIPTTLGSPDGVTSAFTFNRNGTYRFRVAAVNADGEGPRSLAVRVDAGHTKVAGLTSGDVSGGIQFGHLPVGPLMYFAHHFARFALASAIPSGAVLQQQPLLLRSTHSYGYLCLQGGSYQLIGGSNAAVRVNGQIYWIDFVGGTMVPAPYPEGLTPAFDAAAISFIVASDGVCDDGWLSFPVLRPDGAPVTVADLTTFEWGLVIAYSLDHTAPDFGGSFPFDHFETHPFFINEVALWVSWAKPYRPGFIPLTGDDTGANDTIPCCADHPDAPGGSTPGPGGTTGGDTAVPGAIDLEPIYIAQNLSCLGGGQIAQAPDLVDSENWVR